MTAKGANITVAYSGHAPFKGNRRRRLSISKERRARRAEIEREYKRKYPLPYSKFRV